MGTGKKTGAEHRLAPGMEMTPAMRSYDRPRPHGTWGAWAILLSGLLLTSLAARYTKKTADAEESTKFDFSCNEIREKILFRLSAHEQILNSGAAFFEHPDGVGRGEWRRFAERQKLETRLAGIQGIGFSQLIPGGELARHVRKMRAEGFPAYQVDPAGERAVYSAIIYLEPFKGRNLRAFGYDMLSEPVRREAMERARDQGTAALSGKVTLVQETNEEVQAGTLLYVPVYRPGAPSATVAQRRAAILGWVYSPYRMSDLMRGILKGWNLYRDLRIRLELFDGELPVPDALLYDSLPAGERRTGTAPRLTMQHTVVSAGRKWTLLFTRPESLASAAHHGRVLLVFSGGTVISLLLAGLFFNLLNTRQKALLLAGRMTAELKQNEEKMKAASLYARSLIETSLDPLVTISAAGKITDVNAATEKATGLEREKLIGSDFADHFTDPEKARAGYLQVFTQGQVVDYPLALRHASGAVTEVLYNASVYRNEKGEVLGVFAAARDITARKIAELEKEKLAAALAQQKKEMENFLYIATHDLRGPLLNINGYSRELAKDFDKLRSGFKRAALPEDARGALSGLGEENIPAALNFIIESALKMDQVITSLLKVSRQGRVEMRPEALDAGALLRGVLETLNYQLEEAGGTVKAAALPRCTADSGALCHIFTNLLVNAIKYREKSRKLEINVRGGKNGPATVLYTVSDNGRGIPAEDLPRIWQLFYSVDHPDIKKGEGIGLTMVKLMAEANGGRIWAESKEGEGSVFFVEMPA